MHPATKGSPMSINMERFDWIEIGHRQCYWYAYDCMSKSTRKAPQIHRSPSMNQIMEFSVSSFNVQINNSLEIMRFSKSLTHSLSVVKCKIWRKCKNRKHTPIKYIVFIWQKCIRAQCEFGVKLFCNIFKIHSDTILLMLISDDMVCSIKHQLCNAQWLSCFVSKFMMYEMF